MNVIVFKEEALINTTEIRRECLERLERNEQMALTTDQLLEFPQRLRSTYTLWKIGKDLRSTLPKATYYCHRKELRAYGIDVEFFNRAIL
ncbi:MAG: phage/plasmid replication protein [Motiliproteus sp.]